MLKIEKLQAGYGKGQVLHGISMEVHAGEIVALLGLNGAGKSTLLRAISGLIRAAAGKILFNGEDLVDRRPEQIVCAGLAHVPEGRQLFGPLSVSQNLTLGTYARGHRELPFSDDEVRDRVFELLPILRERARQQASRMSGGEQQMLAIARALMSQPRLLMLDEPSVGLAPLTTQRIFDAIASLRASGMGILLVEQDVALALRIADRHYVMASGTLVEGSLADDALGIDAFTTTGTS